MANPTVTPTVRPNPRTLTHSLYIRLEPSTLSCARQSTIEIALWLVHPTFAGFRLSSAARQLATPLVPISRVCKCEDTTCLSIHLNPQVPCHKPLVCTKCNRFWETKLKYGVIPYTEHLTSQRYLCERPFAHEQKKGIVSGDRVCM